MICINNREYFYEGLELNFVLLFQPLFPGESGVDQLVEIIKVIFALVCVCACTVTCLPLCLCPITDINLVHRGKMLSSNQAMWLLLGCHLLSG